MQHLDDKEGSIEVTNAAYKPDNVTEDKDSSEGTEQCEKSTQAAEERERLEQLDKDLLEQITPEQRGVELCLTERSYADSQNGWRLDVLESRREAFERAIKDNKTLPDIEKFVFKTWKVSVKRENATLEDAALFFERLEFGILSKLTVEEVESNKVAKKVNERHKAAVSRVQKHEVIEKYDYLIYKLWSEEVEQVGPSESNMNRLVGSQ